MKLVEYQVSERIAYITMNRPDKRNALNGELVSHLQEAFARAAQDTKAKVIVLKANGKVFSAGADLEYIQKLQENSFQENLADSNKLKDLFQQIYTHDKVVIAQVQGHAIAGGCGLATVCDFVIAQPEAKFGYTEVRIGFIPAIVMVYLLRRVGEGVAKELLLKGQLISAEMALQWGLVNAVVPVAELEQEVRIQAQELIENNSGESMKRTKSLIGKVQALSLEEALDYAARQNAEARSTEDCQQGIRSFINKQPQKW